MSWFSDNIGGIVSGVGGIFGGMASAKGVEEANAASWAHTKELYQNRYQWQAKDMKAAGLNPILAATGGGLSAPVTSALQVQNEAAPLMQGIGMALNSAVSFMQAASKEKEADAALKTAEANEKNAVTNEKNLSLQERIGDSVIKSNLAQAGMFDATTGYYNILGPATSAKYNAEIEKIYADIANNAAIVKGQLELMKSQGALNYAQAQLCAKKLDEISVNITGKHLDNELLLRELQDPEKANRRSYLTSTLGELINIGGNAVKDLTPFRFGIGFSNR